MSRHQQTALICMLAGFLAVIVGYTAFTAGFYAYSTNLPRYKQTTTVGAVNGSQLHVTANTTAQQSHNDAAYYLQLSVIPYDTTTTELVHEDILTITPLIQQLIQQANKAPELPEWVRQ